MRLYTQGANPAVVDLHFRWMQQYGISTAAVQRFAIALRSPAGLDFFNRELREIAADAEKHGRAFFVEYDLSGSSPTDTDMIVADWSRLVQSGLTAYPAYQRVRGRPLIGLWGIGLCGAAVDTRDGRNADRPGTRASARRFHHGWSAIRLADEPRRRQPRSSLADNLAES